MTATEKTLLREIEAELQRLWAWVEQEMARKYAEEQQADHWTEQLPF